MTTELLNAVQHARCYSAITLLAPITQPEFWDESGHGKRLATDIESLRKKCEARLSKKELGSRGDKCRAETIVKMARFLNLHTQKDSSTVDPEKMAAAIVAVTSLVFEAKISCKAWAYGPDWHSLDRLSFELFNDIVDDFPESEALGMKLYDELGNIWDRWN